MKIGIINQINTETFADDNLDKNIYSALRFKVNEKSLTKKCKTNKNFIIRNLYKNNCTVKIRIGCTVSSE